MLDFGLILISMPMAVLVVSVGKRLPVESGAFLSLLYNLLLWVCENFC